MECRMVRRSKKGASMAQGMMPEEIRLPLRVEIGKLPGQQKLAVPPELLPY